MAILQDHSPTPATVVLRLRAALISRVLVEQAKGYLSESLGISVEDAFELLRRYSRADGEHLTDLARRLITEPEAREPILAALRDTARRG